MKLLSSLLLCWLGMTFAVAQTLPAPVNKAMVAAGIPASGMGMLVMEAGTGKVLALANDTRAFNPASVMKLVTTAAALDMLGASYSWKTQVYVDGPVQDGRLDGNLYIKGGGDPRLVVEQFWMLLRQIQATGIREIKGNVIVDRSLFVHDDNAAFDFDGDPQKPYNANPDALLLNFKAIAFRFVPDTVAGIVRVTTEPGIAYEIRPPVLAQGNCGDWQTRLKPRFGETNTTFGGSYAAACGEQVWYVHPYQMKPLSYFSRVFQQMWQDLGGSLQGNIAEGAVAPTARLLTQWESPPLAEAIRGINKFSNNVMARQLLLTLVAERASVPASPAMGQKLLQDWFSAKGIAAGNLVIENGAGLSRKARVTPRMMGEMLRLMYRSPQMPEYVSSMPVVGEDGTMKRRLQDQDIAGKAHIKTGMLDDVRAVGGYVLASSGTPYVVVAFINGRNATKGQAVLDTLLEWVYAQ